MKRINPNSMTQKDKVLMIAEYDGWEIGEEPVYWVSKFTDMYTRNLSAIHTVAMNVVADLTNMVEFPSAENYLRNTKAIQLKRMIQDGCSFPRKQDGYTDLFEAVAAGVEFLNKHKTK